MVALTGIAGSDAKGPATCVWRWRQGHFGLSGRHGRRRASCEDATEVSQEWELEEAISSYREAEEAGSPPVTWCATYCRSWPSLTDPVGWLCATFSAFAGVPGWCTADKS